MYTNLKMQIWKSGMRQNRIAQLLGIDETMLSRIVNGFRMPTQRVRADLAAVLDTDEEWLFQWDGAPGGPERHGAPPSAPGGTR